MINLTQYIKENPFFLAPMAGVTDKAFRSFMREMGCGVITSELVSARALQDNNHRTLKLMEFDDSHRPYGIQIFGENPISIAEGAKKAADYGADFIDLNLGCPVNKIVKKGSGSALLKDLKKLKLVLQALKSSVDIPVSLKVRTGWDDESKNADQVAYIAYEEGFAWMSIHGRTRAQAYSGKADWNYIKQVQAKSSLKIVGNGDLISGLKAYSALKWSDCCAVMIGRACLNDPWIFLSARELMQKENKKHASDLLPSQSEQAQLASDLLPPSLEVKNYKFAIQCLRGHLENFYDERLFLLQLKKFAAWFSAGFPNSTEFRKNIFQEKNQKDLIQKIDEFFTQCENLTKPEPVYEPFLMQGHG